MISEDQQHFTDEELRALAIRWPNLPEEVQAKWMERMNRAQRKRFERTVGKMHEDQRLYATKMINRQDMANFLATYNTQIIMPLAASIDRIEKWIEFQQRPWWRRALVRLAVRWQMLLLWLERRGIRLVDTGPGEGLEGPERPEADSLSFAEEPDTPAPAPVPEPEPAPRGLIEVVSR